MVMKRKALMATAVAAALALGTALTAGPVLAHGPGEGYGMHGAHMGSGMMGHMGSGMHGAQMGSGMMGHMGSGMMGYGAGAQWGCPHAKVSFDKELTVDDVTKFLEQRLDKMGNERLKVGEVKVKDDHTIIADIVTVDDSLVQRLEFDRDTGRHQPIK